MEPLQNHLFTSRSQKSHGEERGRDGKNELQNFCSFPTGGGEPSGVIDLLLNSQKSGWIVISGTYEWSRAWLHALYGDFGQVRRGERGLQRPMALAWLQRKTQKGWTCQLGASHLSWAKKSIRGVRRKEKHWKGGLGSSKATLYLTMPPSNIMG